MEKEPILEIKPEKEKKKKPLGKRMEVLKQRGFFVDKYKPEEMISCQVDGCREWSEWYIDGNCYCPRCMSQKTDEFERIIDEIDKKRAEKK